MLAVLVSVQVIPDQVEAFREATRANAAASIQEPGVVRFDLIQEVEDPTRFQLYEVYRTPDAALAHKDTVHYATWRDTVAAMMAVPRTSTRYETVFLPQ